MKTAANALKTWVQDLLPTCRHVSRLQSRGGAESLPLRRRIGLKLHLLVCSWCRRYGRHIRFLRRAVQAAEEPSAATTPARLSPAARERLRGAVYACEASLH